MSRGRRSGSRSCSIAWRWAIGSSASTCGRWPRPLKIVASGELLLAGTIEAGGFGPEIDLEEFPTEGGPGGGAGGTSDAEPGEGPGGGEVGSDELNGAGGDGGGDGGGRVAIQYRTLSQSGSIDVSGGISDLSSSCCELGEGGPSPSPTGAEGVVTKVQAPVAATGLATGLTSTGATLNAVVNPGGDATTYRFEFGTTTA